MLKWNVEPERGEWSADSAFKTNGCVYQWIIVMCDDVSVRSDLVLTGLKSAKDRLPTKPTLLAAKILCEYREEFLLKQQEAERADSEKIASVEATCDLGSEHC